MPVPPQKHDLSLIEYQLKALEEHQKETDKKVSALEEERNRAMRYGIGVLGAAVLGLASWIFNFVTGGHLK